MSEYLTEQNEIYQLVHFARAPYHQQTCKSRRSEFTSERDVNKTGPRTEPWGTPYSLALLFM